MPYRVIDYSPSRVVLQYTEENPCRELWLETPNEFIPVPREDFDHYPDCRIGSLFVKRPDGTFGTIEEYRERLARLMEQWIARNRANGTLIFQR